jgi:hypothetical protein
MASWELHRQGERPTIVLTGQLSESETATLVRDLELRLTDDVAEVVFSGATTKAGIVEVEQVRRAPFA